MSDWIHQLPVVWMAALVFAATYLATFAIYLLVSRLAAGERGLAFKGVSSGILSPLGVIFGLLVAFVAAQVWGDVDRATGAVNREASALRAVVLLSKALPGDGQARVHALIARHIREARDVDWPAMARHRATFTMVPTALGEALELAVMMPVSGDGQVAVQREMIAALENALDARRQRILASRSGVNWVKWLALVLQALCTLTAIAVVHSDNKPSARIALGLFATAVAVCIVLIAAHDRPFSGQLSVSPDVLLQVQPEGS